MAIRLFNPQDIPFGPLSNNATEWMTIVDGTQTHRWKSVTHYVYAKMLCTRLAQASIRKQRSVKHIRPLYEKLYIECDRNNTLRALQTALKVKFENEAVRNVLLSTENSLLNYMDNNDLYLGMDEEGKGDNVMGKYLMQIRRNYKIIQDRETKHTRIYTVYRAFKALENAMKNDYSDLSEYIGDDYDQIVKRYTRNGEREFKEPDKSQIIEMYEGGHLDPILKDEIDDSGNSGENMVLKLRESEFENIKKNIEEKRDSIIFNMYLDYMLEKNYEDLDPSQYSDAKIQMLLKLEQDDLITDLISRVSDLFRLGMLSNTLSNKIDEKLKEYPMPKEDKELEDEEEEIVIEPSYRSEDELKIDEEQDEEQDKEILVSSRDSETQSDEDEIVKELKDEGDDMSFEFDRFLREGVEGIQEKIDLVLPPVIYIYPILAQNDRRYVSLSPLAYTGMLEIDNYLFPTVYHYIITYKLSLLPLIGGMKNAHLRMKATPDADPSNPESYWSIDNANKLYHYFHEESYVLTLQHYTREVLNIKFKDPNLKMLLIFTGNARILYTSKDRVLGTGKKGEKNCLNYTGNYLMELRENFQSKIEPDYFNIYTVSMQYKADPLIQKWIKMRVQDMCHTVETIERYLHEKYGIDRDLTEYEVDLILNKIYQKCREFTTLGKKVEEPVPKDFQEMIKKCIPKAKMRLINSIWKRLSIMIYWLMKSISTRNSDKVMNTLEGMISYQSKKIRGKCTLNVYNSSDKNCVLSALVNIMFGIKEFITQSHFKYSLSVEDVVSAASILLNEIVLNYKTKAEDIEDIRGVLEELDENVEDKTIEVVNWMVDNVLNYDIDSEVKFNRINFYSDQEVDRVVKFEVKSEVVESRKNIIEPLDEESGEESSDEDREIDYNSDVESDVESGEESSDEE